MSKSPTRQQYMNHECSFAEFYRAVNATAGLVMSDGPFLDRVRKALAAGDEHLNSIPLSEWDAKALEAQSALTRALRGHGDFYSLSGGVCCMKQAAKDAANAK